MDRVCGLYVFFYFTLSTQGEEEIIMMCMVVEGGANRTIFSVGVMDAFLEESIMPDHFIGVSAGAAFGVSYLAKQKFIKTI